MWRFLAIGAAISIALGLIAVGLTMWRDWRPFTDQEHDRSNS